MARKTTRKKPQNSTVEKGLGYVRELAALGMISLATLLALSLVSYDPHDDTILFNNPASEGMKNYIGAVGANVSALLIQLLGYCAFLVPAALFAAGGCLVLRIKLASPATKAVGLTGLVLGSAVLLSLLVPELSVDGMAHAFPGGGVLGGLLLDYLRNPFSDLAVYIISASVVAVSLVLTVNFSFAGLFRGAADIAVSQAKRVKQNRRERKTAGRSSKDGKKSPVVVVRLELPWKKRRKEAERVSSLPTAVNKELPFDEPARASGGQQDEEFEPILVKPVRRRRRSMVRSDGRLPPVALLDDPPERDSPLNLKMLSEQARVIVNRYNEFGIEGEVLQTNPGPVVNTFEFRPAPGVKYNRVIGLSDELCMALKAVSVRINRMPGKSTVGIEVPNHSRDLISFREVIESPEYEHAKSPLTLSLGKQINGDPYVTALDAMPHLLLAGATGTGKSVSLHSMLCSILYKAPADKVKFILIDPKQVELNCYNGIPHLLTPVVCSPKRAANALRWACEEMESRYQRLAAEGCRNIEQYNRVAAETQLQFGDLKDDVETAEAAIEPIPYIVIAIDELSDLMMVSSADVEESICRLAQKARAVGIHLIVATQRPSVDVLTGVIKANFQCRIAFRVATKVDSRTILDSNGAENLLGDGDMLFLPPRSSRLIRLHGPFIGEKEIERTINFLREQENVDYDDDILTLDDQESGTDLEDLAPAKDPLYDNAVSLVLSTSVASISNLQRKMRLGYARAARIIDNMEREGIIGPPDGSKPRQILRKDYLDSRAEGRN